MTARNDVTGDLISSKKATDSYRDGWDRIFGKKEVPQTEPAQEVKEEEPKAEPTE